MPDTNALDIVIEALRSDQHPVPPESVETDAGVFREAVSIARQNKVLSQIWKRLFAAGDRATYLAEVAATMAANTALLDALPSLALLLNSADVPFLVIKGPLQQKLFHGDFFQRTSADVDILVRPQHYRAAKHRLLEAGYESKTPSVWWRGVLGEEHLRQVTPPFIAVDLHHRVHQPGTPPPFDGEILFDGLTRVAVRGVNIPTLNAPYGLLLCTISIAKALYNREPAGAHLLDLYAGLMAAAPDAVNAFYTMAAKAGLGGHAAVALRLMGAVLGVPLTLPQARDALGTIRDSDLCRIALLPRHPATAWPKRREILWTLCEQQPRRYRREFVRIVRSEIVRRGFERPLPV